MPHYAEIMNCFAKWFPVEQERDYMLSLVGSCFAAAPTPTPAKSKKLYILVGPGANGKSQFMQLVNATLGEHAGALPASTLTRKWPVDVTSVAGKHFISIGEPAQDQKINDATLKQFLDEDFTPICGQLFMMCNSIPTFSSFDYSVQRRIVVIPFRSRFCQNPVAKNEYLADHTLHDKITTWSDTFKAILTSKRSVPMPLSIMDETQHYCEIIHTFQRFASENIIRDAVANVSFNDICDRFKSWNASSHTRNLYQLKTWLTAHYEWDYDEFAGIRLSLPSDWHNFEVFRLLRD